jgi:hypothetical protein
MCSNILVWYQTFGRIRDQSERATRAAKIYRILLLYPHFLLLHLGSLSSRGSRDVDGKVGPSSLSVCSVVWWAGLTGGIAWGSFRKA